MRSKNVLGNQAVKKEQKSLSVCFFSHWAGLGGAERVLLELITELIEDYGVICTVVLPKAGPLKKRLEQIGALTHIIEYSWWYDPKVLPAEQVTELCTNSVKNLLYGLKEMLGRINPDIIVTSTIVIPWGAITASFLRKPHVWFVQEFGGLDHGLKPFLPPNLTSEVIKNFSTLILTPCNAVRKALFPNLNKKKALTVYHYINIPPTALYQNQGNYFARKNAAKLMISAEVKTGKGQKDAILAVKELVQRGRNVELIIMGYCNDDQYTEHLKDIISQGNLGKRVKLFGFKDNPYPIMNQADIGLICSKNEAFACVATEWMLLKKPVIGTNSACTPEQIKEGLNGLLYKPGNYHQLADKIEYLIDHPNKARRLGENGYKFAKKTFTKSKFGGKIYKLLLNLKRKVTSKTSFSGLNLEGPALLDSLLTAAKCKDQKITALITELGSSLRLGDSKITELTDGLQNRDAQIAELKNNLQEKESQIHSLEFHTQQIQQSILMQLASRYDRAVRKILPLGTRRRHYYELGLTSIRIILNKGWKSFWLKSKVWLRQKNTEKKIANFSAVKKPPADDWSDYEILSQKIAEINTKKLKNLSPKPSKRKKQLNDLNPVRLITFYFPQYHSIPENDHFWGEGFTEWTMVKRTQPNFVGHYQPHVPIDLGYYDLNNVEIMEQQAELAKRYGIYGFCYYYYWFHGKRVMEMPLERMLKTGKPDIPFCLCWANENWTRRWDGRDDLVLLEQQHSDKDDHAVIRDLMRYMRHPNYIRVNGKPLLLIYRVGVFPDIKRTAEIWRDLCRKEGIGDIYLAMCETFEHASGNIPPSKYGFDASVEFPPHADFINFTKSPGKMLNPHFRGLICNYREAILRRVQKEAPSYTCFRTVVPAWDNTPRRQNDSSLFVYSSPGAYQAWLKAILRLTMEHNSGDERIVFINAWNEWGEGAYLEPDRRYGHKFLEATRKAMEATSGPITLKTESFRPVPNKIVSSSMLEKTKVGKSNDQGIICIYPFSLMGFSYDGNTYNCICPDFIKDNIGNIKHSTIAEMWNSDTARWIRRKMYAGEWQDICKPTCPILRSNKFIKYEELEKIELLNPGLIKEIRAKKDYLESPPTYFKLDNSGICNLRCIMCGAGRTKDDPVVQKKLWADLKNYLPTAKEILLTGWGEPFARPDTRELLINYKGTAKFHLLTNGLLLPRYWEQIKHQKFTLLEISVDAATKETYEKIRVGGKWEDLLKTLNLARQERDKFGDILIKMTVMRSNYKEIPQFIDLAELYGFNCTFHAVEEEWNNENIFELNDTKVLNELRKIIINENSKKRCINVSWVNLPYYLNLKQT